MIKGKGITLDAYVSSSDNKPIPVPEKPIIDETSLKDVIKYNGRIFEVPTEMIHYLADLPENLQPRIGRTKRNGMGFMYPDGSTGCHYCNHYTSNIANILSDNGVGVTVHNREGTRGIAVTGCNYEQKEDVRWASTFQNRETGEVVMAQKTPCVVHDSMIAMLADSGAFDQYEVKGRAFQFPTITEIIQRSESGKKEEVQPITDSRISKIYNHLKDLCSR
jgi:hypothetical protein